MSEVKWVLDPQCGTPYAWHMDTSTDEHTDTGKTIVELNLGRI